MTWDQWLSLGSLVVAGAMLAISLLRGARLAGADRNRLEELEARLEQLPSREAVNNMGGRLDELEAEVKQVATAVTEILVVKEKVTGLDRLVTSQLDEIKHSLRRMEERSFDPAPPGRAAGRRGSSGSA